jgi:hypothetical protein
MAKKEKKKARSDYANNKSEKARLAAMLEEYQELLDAEVKVSVKKLCQKHNLPRTTARRHIEKYKEGLGLPDRATGQALTAEEEDALVRTLFKRAEAKKPVNIKETCALATKLLRSRKPGAKALGPKWSKGFLKRHPEAKKRKKRDIDAMRAEAMKKPRIEKWMLDLKKMIEEEKLEPADILNFDESEAKPFEDMKQGEYVIVPREYKRADSRAMRTYSGHITFGATIAADGSSHIPLTIFTGKTIRTWMIAEDMEEQLISVSENGWMTTKIFLAYLKKLREKMQRKVLLIVDGHVTREDAEVLEYCRANEILLFKLPAHTTHRLQPLDVVIFPAFKKQLRALVNDWGIENSEKTTMTKEVMLELIAKAYQVSTTAAHVQAAFRKSGVFPVSIDALPADAFTAEEKKGEEKEEKKADDDDMKDEQQQQQEEKDDGGEEEEEVKQPAKKKRKKDPMTPIRVSGGLMTAPEVLEIVKKKKEEKEEKARLKAERKEEREEKKREKEAKSAKKGKKKKAKEKSEQKQQSGAGGGGKGGGKGRARKQQQQQPQQQPLQATASQTQAQQQQQPRQQQQEEAEGADGSQRRGMRKRKRVELGDDWVRE